MKSTLSDQLCQISRYLEGFVEPKDGASGSGAVVSNVDVG
jgi:hypothetical protein